MKSNINNRFIPIYQPLLGGNEKKYVTDCLDENWISSKGKYIGEFESKFAEYINVNHATTVSNGTVALHLALLALGIGPGDEVIVPTFTYVASVNAISYVGAKPVFVDSLKDTWNIDCEDVKKKVTAKTKAVMAVHMYGNPCDMDSLAEICRMGGIFLIEDAAEAFGSVYKGQLVGGLSDVATFSFFGNKTITTGEGGMVVSNDEYLISRVSYLKSQAVSQDREYWHDEIGFNYRMTNICAAIGLAQLEQARTVLEKKRTIYNWYSKYLNKLPVSFQETTASALHTYWMVSVLFKNNNVLDKVRVALKKNLIETRPLFPPVHSMPVFNTSASFPVAESLSLKGINLPSYPELEEKEIEKICAVIAEVFECDTDEADG